MKGYVQYIIAAVMAVVLALVGIIIVTGGKINIPGVSQKIAEVEFTASRGWWSDDIVIKNAVIYDGIPLWSIGPLFAAADFRVEGIAYHNNIPVGNASKIIGIEWWSGVTDKISIPTENWSHGITIVLKLVRASDSAVRDTDTYTIY